ncbi:MAG TPA: aldehyde ferredoxin oxidoreductase family protein [Dehalococcoidales bacterium]|nr:aldehyde ferredoxin oxidoreductase family protein [Dehalococcoidales bacterium]
MAINTGRILRVNLTSGRISHEIVPEKIAADFIGGRGYGIRYLWDEIKPGIDPLGEENKLLLITGPLAGTSALALSRWMAITKSPLTGAFARSVCGADFGAWLKFAGFEMIILEGKADKPAYLHISQDNCRIESAGEIWGKDTKITQEWLTAKHGKDTRAACIGPAGERLVRFAAIVSDRRTAGRCGTGAVMGSKNLKAVAITAKRRLFLADPVEFTRLAKEQATAIKDNPSYLNHKEWGTTATQDVTNKIGVYPVRNFKYGQMLEPAKIAGTEYRKFRTGDMGCYACPARCGKVHTVPAGPYAGAKSEGPEYESIWSFTGPIESDSIEASVAADQLCDDLGLDTISTGNTIGFAYELYEKGLITREDTGGLELNFGSHAPMVDLIKKIAFREGIGNLLADGTRRAAEAVGHNSSDYAIHVKGLELPAYEPRGAKTHGYNYVTANIGASHCYGYSAQDIFGAPFPRPTDRFAEDYPDLVIFNQDSAAWKETGIQCTFTGGWGYAHLYGSLLVAARGLPQIGDNQYLEQVGHRIFNLERAFNVRDGFGRKDDTLPRRLLTESLHTRAAAGEGQIVRSLDKFLDSYYSLRGWSLEGIPSAAKLDELGLSFVAAELAQLKR